MGIGTSTSITDDMDTIVDVTSNSGMLPAPRSPYPKQRPTNHTSSPGRNSHHKSSNRAANGQAQESEAASLHHEPADSLTLRPISSPVGSPLPETPLYHPSQSTPASTAPFRPARENDSKWSSQQVKPETSAPIDVSRYITTDLPRANERVISTTAPAGVQTMFDKSAAVEVPTHSGLRGPKDLGPSRAIAASSPMNVNMQFSSSVPSTNGFRLGGTASSSITVGTPLFPEVLSSAHGSKKPPPASAFGRIDPFDDEEGWGQEIPQILLLGGSADSLPNVHVARSTGTGKANNNAQPVELPAHLERALLNAAPVSDDPSMLPLPHHVMLNHLYERPPSINSPDGRPDHIILGLTVRYRDDKFVTLVLYKPIPHEADHLYDS